MGTLDFLKMQGTGNDFVFFDAREHKLPHLSKLAGELCDRRFGVGADQMLLLERSSKADFRMRIFNADGSEVEQCGNGIRCLARYVWTRGLSKKKVLSVETGAGIARLQRAGSLVEVEMGEPVLDGERIPTRARGRVVNRPLKVEDREFRVTCVSMGNPHCVIFGKSNGVDLVEQYGPLLERHPFFPKRTNVEFVDVKRPNRLQVGVWERGAGRTLSCGTGACATVVAGVLNGKTSRDCEIVLPGGTLRVRWDARSNRVYMTGPAEEVFAGRIPLSPLSRASCPPKRSRVRSASRRIEV
ncbi:MAG: diaminopimelate epimerase [Nitrospirae bacterium]|nr:diaminopimelate epimerase [Nitrospirota bacterium]